MLSRVRNNSLADLIYWGLLALIVILPFHALIVDQLAGILSYTSIIEAWKEVLIVGLSVLAAFAVFINTSLRNFIFKQKTTWLILLFLALHLLYILIFSNSLKAEIVGLRTNTMFLVVFLLAEIAGWHHSYKRLSERLMYVVCGVAVVVATIAFAQALFPTYLSQILSNNFNTNPYSFVQDSPILRVNATLWGPSQLGSYLILPIALAFWQRLRTKNWRWTLALGVMIVGLFASQSRAAWIATILSLGIVWAYHYRHLVTRQRALGLLSILLVLGAALVFVGYRTDSPLSRLIFHASSSNAISESSNSDRFDAINHGIDQFIAAPLGSGVGTAGPASTYAAHSLYTESFYIQLLVEVGFVGLLLFLAISIAILRRLYIAMNLKPMTLPVLATGVGIVAMNAVHHTWADASTAIMWWAVAGLLLSSQSK